jgi:hypothetical protein
MGTSVQVVFILRADLISGNRDLIEKECQALKERILGDMPAIGPLGDGSTASVEYSVSEVQTTNDDTQQESTHMWQVLFNNGYAYNGTSKDQAISTFGLLMSGAQREQDAKARITLLQDSKGIQEFHNLCLTTLSQTVP